MLARSWLTNVANGISLSIWYDWRDDGLDPNEPEHHFGLVSNSYHQEREPVCDPKPAYFAAKTLATFFSGYRFAERLSIGEADDYVLAFRKDGELRFAVWTTANRAHEVLIPLGAGSYSTMGHTGRDLGTITVGPNGTAITLTSAPIYIR